MSMKVFELVKVADSRENLDRLENLVRKADELNGRLHINNCNCLIIASGLATEEQILEEIDANSSFRNRRYRPDAKAVFTFCDIESLGRETVSGHDVLKLDVCTKYTGSPVVAIIKRLFPESLVYVSVFDESYAYDGDGEDGCYALTDDTEQKVFPKYQMYRRENGSSVLIGTAGSEDEYKALLSSMIPQGMTKEDYLKENSCFEGILETREFGRF